MKKIGLIGGMSWESTLEYYRIINREVARRYAERGEGDLHSAECVLVSVDFDPIEKMQAAGDWDAAAGAIAEAGRACEAAGADFIVLCTNTMHRTLPQVEPQLGIPFLHIADATAERIREAGVTRVGLLGTRYTMEGDFYRGRLEEHGLTVLTPPPADRELVNRVIYEELVLGRLIEKSREEYRRVITGLVEAGAGAIIAGCTEIGLLVKQEDSAVPLFDTAQVHAEAAVRRALE
jgi:aspartate racemase